MADDSQTTVSLDESEENASEKIRVEDLETMFADGAENQGGQRRRWGLLMFTPPEVEES